MNILMTGFTPIQCNSKHRTNVTFSNTDAMHAALTALGYEVNWRAPNVHEDPRGYDLVVLGLYGATAMAGHYSIEAAAVVVRAKELGVPVVAFVDDWHLHIIKSQGNTGGWERDDFVEKRVDFRYGGTAPKAVANRAWAKEFMAVHRTAMRDTVSLADPIRHLILPVHGWSINPDTVARLARVGGFPVEKVVAVDPTPIIPTFTVARSAPAYRGRQWVLASRYDMTEWAAGLHLGWPTLAYGYKKGGQPTVPTEVDLVRDVYAKNWGVLSHPYPRGLVGQWRNRYQFAALAGCVLYADPAECPPTPGYQFDPRTVEALPDYALQALAGDQAAALAHMSWTRDRYLEAIKGVIDAS